MKIAYLEPAKRDFERFRDFLRAADVSEDKISEIIKTLVSDIRILKDNPKIGRKIGGKFGFDTEYRALVCGRYVAIYEIAGNTIEVRRIFHGKEDYVAVLITDASKPDSSNNA
jgi:plasmid stabilization system protein ParE